MVLILRDKVAVLQALASTVNRVSRIFRFLCLTLLISHLMFTPFVIHD